MTRTIDQMISQEVLCCMSGLVSTLAPHWGTLDLSRDTTNLADVIEQAGELASPIPDYEEGAIQESWTGPYKDDFGVTYFQCGADAMTWAAPDWEALCRDHDIEPYDREVYEHWAVSDWLADKLIAKGEKVDKDFAGLCVWARTTTGQAISMDSVIESIYADMMAA